MLEMPLGELLEVVIDHRGKTPKKLGGDFTMSGIPVVSAIHIKNGVIQWSERERYVSPEMYAKWMPVRLAKGDVLLTSEAPLGETALVPSDDNLVLSQRLFALRGKVGILDSGYLRYFLASRVGQERLQERATGTTVLGIRQAELMRVLIPVPQIDEQRRIAGVLGALDDLIEVNRGLIRDQFDLARAVFSREATKTDEFLALGDLYSAGLSGVWGEDQAGGSATEEVAVLRGRDLEDVWAVNALQAPRRYLSAKQVASRRPEIGEIWTAGSGSLGPSLAVLEDLPKLFGQSTVLYSNFVKRLVPNRGPSWFGPAWLSMIEAWQSGRFENYRTGTAMPNLDTDALLRGVEVPDLSSASRALVNRLVRAALDPSLREEILELERARDELLPLLMSGRVRVGEVGAA